MEQTMTRQLIEAIRKGDTHLARDILLTDRYGCIDGQTAKRDGTALFWACAKGFLELVQLLIAKGANVNTRTNYQSTPLIAAADRNRYEVMRLLIQQGADVNAQTSKGDTACHLAAYRGHLEAVKVLLGAGADVDITNTHFRTPYDDAIREGRFDVLPLLEGSEKLGAETKLATSSIANTPSLYQQQHQQNHYHHHQTQHVHQPNSSGKAPEPSVTRVEARRDSCDCLSNQSLSRESSYEDCGGQAMMNGVDWDDRLRSRDLPDFIAAEILADAAAANMAAGIPTPHAPGPVVSQTFPAPTSSTAASNLAQNPASVYLSAPGHCSQYSSNNYYVKNNDGKHCHHYHHHHPHHHGALPPHVASNSSGVSPFLATGGDAPLTASGVPSSQGRLGGGGGGCSGGVVGDGALQRLPFPGLVEDSDHYLHFPQHHHLHQHHHDHYQQHLSSGSSLGSFDMIDANDLSSLAESSIPYGSYNDSGSNDLSLASDRPSSKKSLMSRMNIPA